MAEISERVIQGAFVKTGTVCNLNCLFCPMDENGTQFEPAKIESDLRAVVESGCGRAILVGGEPPIHGDFLKIVSATKRMGLRMGLATNGRIFFYGGLLETLVRYGLDSVIIGLNSCDGETHDSIVNVKGAFGQTAEALKNIISKDGILVEVRTTLVRGNSGRLNDVVRFLAELSAGKGNAYLVIAYGEPSDGALKKNSNSFLAPGEAAEAIKLAFDAARECGLSVYYEGLPDCLMDGLSGRNMETFDRFFTGSAGADSCVRDRRFNGYSKPLLCSECALDRSCRGVPSNIRNLFDFQGVKPVMGVRSNSFDYTEEAEIEGFVPSIENCAGLAVELNGAPSLNLFLRRGGKTVLYHTDTNSFSLSEIDEIKNTRRQLYIDISDKVALDDYQKDVRQLKLAGVCAECLVGEDCAKTFEVKDEVPFYREERWLKGEIGRMKGRVLDVGCGDLRYQEIIGGLVAEGAVEYHGLDPDMEALNRLRESGIRMRIHTKGMEDFDCEKGYFDYIMMLRSFNHFYNLDRVFEVALNALRNYGILIMTDCLPFALLRSREKTSEARASLKPKFEHYRNWSSEQVLGFIRMRGLPLRVNIHRPVLPKTGNMWLLKLIKIEG